MSSAVEGSSIIRSGDVSGRSTVYDPTGDLITETGEIILRVATGWDMTACTPWRRILPTVIFLGFNKPASSRLYVTSKRVILIREIDSWRQAVGDMTPLGIPNAIATKVELDRLKAAGIRQFCEIRTHGLRVVRVRRSAKAGAWLGLRLIGDDGLRYAVSFWKTDGEDSDTLSLIAARFRP